MRAEPSSFVRESLAGAAGRYPRAVAAARDPRVVSRGPRAASQLLMKILILIEEALATLGSSLSFYERKGITNSAVVGQLLGARM